MKIQGPVQTITEAFKNQLNRQGPNLGKKNIPSKNSNSKPDKPLSERKVKNLGINPPSFQSPLSEKKEISIALWAHWSGKNQEDVKASYAQLEKVNGSALLTIQKFIAEGNQVHACQIPGVIVLTEQGIFSDFLSRLSELLEKALSRDESLRNQIYQSDGILKTPIVITRISNEKAPMRSESVENVSSAVSFYPYADTAQRSDTSMLTLYINDLSGREPDLIKGLKEGLKKATEKADGNLPQLPDISSKPDWSDLTDYYGVTSEEQLLAKFKKSSLDELPDLSVISSWPELPDKYLMSKEIVQKYLR